MKTPHLFAPKNLGQTFSLHRRFALLLACVLAALWMAVAWDNHKTEQDAHAQMRQQTAALAMAFADHTEATFQRADHLLLQLREFWLANPKTFADAIAREQALLGDTVIQIGVINADGYLIYSNLAPMSTPVDLSDREHFKVHRDAGQADRLFISRPVKGRVSGKWSIQLTRPIFDGGRFAGVLVLSLDPGYFVRYYQRFNLGTQGIVSIVRDSGEIMALAIGQVQDGMQYIGRVIGTAPVTDAGAALQGSYHRSASLTDGTERLFSYYRLPERGVSVRIGVGVNDYLTPVRAQQRTAWLIAGAVTLILSGLFWLLLRGLARLQTAESVVSKDRQRLANIVWGTGVGTWEWNVQTGETRFNERWAELVGYTLEELAPINIDTWMRLAHPDDLAASGALLERHFAGEIDHYDFEARVRHKDGHWIWVLDRGKVVSRTPDGRPEWMAGTHMEITARKQAEESVRESEAFTQGVLNSLASQIAVIDNTGTIVAINQFWRQFSLENSPEPGQMAPNTDIGTNYLAMCRADVSPGSDEALCAHDGILAVLAGRLPAFSLEYPCHSPQEQRWFRLNVTPLLNSGSRGAVVVHDNITTSKLAEIALAESEDNFRTFYNSVQDFLFVLDMQGEILFINDYVQARLHYTAEELYGQSVLMVHPKSRREEAMRIVTEMLAGTASLCPVPLQAKDGQLIPVETRVVRGHWNGQPAMFGLSRDMTERVEAEEALHQKSAALARSNAELEQFAYVASHDLRQPLRMVNSYVQLLERRLADKLDAETREMMHFATDGAKRLDQMLVSLLEYSRVGRKGEPLAPLASRSGVDEALRFLVPAINEANATVRVSGDWPEVVASRDEFTRLWQNLIGNAVKYRAPERNPEIDITVTPEADGWRFCVTDNGIGIEPTQFDRLFKVFQRLHTREQYEGTGIGLAVARKIVERHGGRIWVESGGIGLGCRFCFNLPQTPPSEALL